jgi:hypothetical protein
VVLQVTINAEYRMTCVKLDVDCLVGYGLEQDRRKTISLRYGHVEAALADAMHVKEADQKTFRARLRHFRNIGVPSGLPEVTKGAPIDFTRGHAFEMLLALETHNTGLSPKHAASFAREIMVVINDRKEPLFDTIFRQEPLDWYAILFPNPDEVTDVTKINWGVVLGLGGLEGLLRSRERYSTVLLVNLSALAIRLNEALIKVLLGDDEGQAE